MKKVVIQGKRRVFDGFFKIDEAELSFERFDGRMSRPVKRLCFERGDSVAIVIYERDARRIVLTRQFKYPTHEKGPGWIVEVAAGMLEPGETPEAAVRREVLEELGYQVGTVEPIACFYVSPGGSSERILLYYAEVSSAGRVGPGGGVASEDEDIEVVEVPVSELERLLTTGELQDAKTLIGLQWLRARLEKAKG
jgi:nudix-type nucleoside diphosphatase (YffH/AdpP family)